MRSTLRNRGRFHEIDGLRALAVTLVFLHHGVSGPLLAGLRARGWGRLADLVFNAGASGVELFFVLSGVVLLRPYLRRERALDVGRYFRRRIARLWPPYLAALVGSGLVILIINRVPTWYSRNLIPVFDFRDWIAQIAIFNFGWPTYNGSWWSLTIELTFYLLAPIVVIMFRPTRIGWGVSISFLIGAVIFSELATVAGPRETAVKIPLRVATQFVVYLPCFLWGALIARFDFAANLGRTLFAVGAVASVAASVFPVINIHAAAGTMFAGLVIAAADRKSTAHQWLARPLLVWLGERSYSIFLVHFSIFYLADWAASLVFTGRTLPYFIVSRAIGLPLALLAAMVLFWTIERRFAPNLATADRFAPWQMPQFVSEEDSGRAYQVQPQ